MKTFKSTTGSQPADKQKPATIRTLTAASHIGCIDAALKPEIRVWWVWATKMEPRETSPAHRESVAVHEGAAVMLHLIQKRRLRLLFEAELI
jgi:hypothetical protein